MNLPSWSYRVLWLFFAAVFGVIEAVALVDDDRGDTLSEHVWELRDLHPAAYGAIAIFMGWLTWHFLCERRR